MRNHRVLENDIDLNQIDALATSSGFSRLSVKVALDHDLALSEYNALFGDGNPDAVRSEIANQAHNATHNRSIFFLHKGEVRPDSRSHEGLAHTIATDESVRVVPAGKPLQVALRVTNAGQASWLHTNVAIFGIVRVGTHLYDESGGLVAIDHSRHDLPARVEPGQVLQLNVTIPLPESGSWRVAIDLVSEAVTWFENRGSTPVYVTARRTL